MLNVVEGIHARELLPFYLKGAPAIGLLLFRVVVGAGFLRHSLVKLKHPSRWMQTEGIPPDPPGLQTFAAVLELSSGAGCLLGLLSPLAAIGMLATMLGAMLKVHIPNRHPFVAAPGSDSAETCVLYSGAALLLLLVGPGMLSFDAILFRMLLSQG